MIERVGLEPAQHERLGQRPQPRPAPPRRRASRPAPRSGCGTPSRVPSRPGLTRSSSAHRSASRFSTGVPVTAMPLAASAACGRPRPPWSRRSSPPAPRRARPGATGPRRSAAASRASSAYVVTSRSQAGDGRRRTPCRAAAPRRGARAPAGPAVNRAGLALPVADERHRADQQRRRAGALPADQRQQLHRLAQAHVVGEHAADADLLEERQPGQPALLVRPQRAHEPVRRRDGREPLLGLPDSRSPSQPSASDVDDRQPARARRPRRLSALQHVGQAQRAGDAAGAGTPAPGPAGRGRPASTARGPGPAAGRPRRAARPRRSVRPSLADGELPAEVDEPLLPDARAAVGRARLARGCRPAAGRRAGPAAGPTTRAAARRSRTRRAAAPSRTRKACAPAVSRSSRGRARRPQRRRQAGVQADRPPELGEQRLLRVGDPPGERRDVRAAPPDLLGVDDQARARRWPAARGPAARRVRVLSARRRLVQPEAGAHRAGRRRPAPASAPARRRATAVALAAGDGARGARAARRARSRSRTRAAEPAPHRRVGERVDRRGEPAATASGASAEQQPAGAAAAAARSHGRRCR